MDYTECTGIVYSKCYTFDPCIYAIVWWSYRLRMRMQSAETTEGMHGVGSIVRRCFRRNVPGGQNTPDRPRDGPYRINLFSDCPEDRPPDCPSGIGDF